MTICIMFIQRLFAFNGCLYIDDFLFPNLKKKNLTRVDNIFKIHVIELGIDNS